MKKGLKCLLAGSLMCLIVSGFDTSYGMMTNKDQRTCEELYIECNKWETELKEIDLSCKEYAEHVKKKYEEAIGHFLNAHLHGGCGLEKNDTSGLTFAIEYANKGSEVAIGHLISTYLNGWYSCEINLQNAIDLAKKYQKEGSVIAARYLQRIEQK